MNPLVDSQSLANRAAIIGSQELLRRMVATGHIWPTTMKAHIDRHGLAPCLRPRAAEPASTVEEVCQRPITPMADILAWVAQREGLTVEVLTGRTQTKPIMRARRRAIRLLYRLGFSLNAIGRVLNRNHSTISSALFGKRSNRK